MERYLWGSFGLGAGLVVAALISVVLHGRGWPYYLGLGIAALAVALAIGLRLREPA